MWVGLLGSPTHRPREKMAENPKPSGAPNPSRLIVKISFAISLVLQLLIFNGGYFLWPSIIPVPKANNFESKAVFTLRCLLPPVLVLSYAVAKVAMMRFLGYAKNPLGEDELIQNDKNFLQNTMEQLFIFLLTAAALMTYLDGEEMRLIPLYSFVFVLGRILYRIGYPTHRAFGFAMAAIPSFVLGNLTLYFMFARGFAV